MIEAVLFDLDGVLFNSENFWYRAFNKTLRQHKHTTISFEEYEEKCKGGHVDDDIQTFFGELPHDTFLLVKKTYKSNFLDLLPHSRLYPNAKEVLKRIKALGYKTAIITQTDSDLLLPMMEYFKIEQYFDTYVTGDMVERRKPFPDSVLLGCQKLNVEPKNTIYFEDSPRGVEAGKSAGVIVVAITHTSTKEELINADHIIPSLDLDKIEQILTKYQ